jgi:hypothetical protein
MRVFERIDLDGDGSLSWDELVAAAAHYKVWIRARVGVRVGVSERVRVRARVGVRARVRAPTTLQP